MVVLPTTTSETTKERRAILRAGTWEKVRRACVAAESAGREPAGAGGLTDQRGAGLRYGAWEHASANVPVLQREHALDEVEDALEASGPYPNVALLERAMRALGPREREFPCFAGCGATVTLATHAEHREECPCRREACPCCQMLVPQSKLDHHREVCEELEAALRSWRLKRLESATQAAERHCAHCRVEHRRLHAAVSLAADLQERIHAVMPVLARGHVTIDFDTREVAVATNIPFAARKPPDSSAEFKPGEEEVANSVIADLAVVIRTFEVPMVIEGHTGETEPEDFWRPLSQNRANLIVELMESQLGVRPGLAIPLGCPGGGAKVVVCPA